MTFAVQPDPISGQHCWHQAVVISKAAVGDRLGDIYVDAGKANEVYKRWLELTRRADLYSPGHTRRPFWMMRPLKPDKEAFSIPGEPG